MADKKGSLWEQIKLRYEQYTLVTAVNIMTPVERCIVNGIVVGLTGFLVLRGGSLLLSSLSGLFSRSISAAK